MDNFRWIRPNINLKCFIKDGEYNVILHNSGDLVSDFKYYAEQFYAGAENLMAYLLNEASSKGDIAKLDLWYFAIVYLYRQSLELLLKSTLFQYIVNFEDRKIAIGSIRHDLAQGLELLLNSIPEAKESQEHEGVIWLKSFFEDISRVDRESDMFRYPFGNNMKVLFEKQTHISLVATQTNMQTAFYILKDINKKGCSFIGNHIVYDPKLIIEGGAYYEQSVVGYKYAERKFYPYFSSYEEAAKHLENEIKQNHNSALFLPMCYLFRNAVELGLKRIILEDSHVPYDEAMKKLKRKKHSLVSLWNSISVEIANYANAPDDDTTLIDTNKYIHEFHNFDQESDIFRYPVNKKLLTYFGDGQTFDMLNVAGCFHELCNFLDAVDGMLSEIKQVELEMMYEYESEMHSEMNYYNDY
ncbi:hypothetical protein GC105_00795 [Alkalibaculum sp. M08DMB]|uniref:Uncharacterized protein n=1 Tax=Alkalibaculum sporogenes TaxID=2655001 RepID=A0A6A7K4L6_9FIRM|nr:hypothetical protein [Alkalibaculum sporogenes]MPW24330.1 hypothetical protein [Alkalibaculum sporogenes]